MKKIYLPLIIMLYIIQIIIFIGIYNGINSEQLIQENKIVKATTLIAILISIICFIYSIFLMIYSIKNIIINKESYNKIYKNLMIYKLVLIPFFIINFILWFLLISAMLNPFLFLSEFILIPLSIGFTYIILLTTSIPILTTLLSQQMKKEINLKDNKYKIISLFIFCLDVIGSILIYNKQRIKEVK